ncbi:hypothetical protein R1sor_001490 [Riccia sorocarpa]|uniref:Uncharacterized protein n=1 Tax=Riccia sorocarpa TaxID=122646 RepID=A0ABD3GWZ1_9MARC
MMLGPKLLLVVKGRTALIAWDRVALPKAEGGLGWTKFKVMADALNVRQVSRIIEGGCAEWIQLARSFILRTLRRGSYQRECSQWTVQEGLILLPLTRMEGSPTLTRMLNSWYRARKKLHWKGGSSELNGNLTMLQLTAMHQITSKVGVSGLKPGKELGILRKAHIDNFGDARMGGKRWKLENLAVCFYLAVTLTVISVTRPAIYMIIRSEVISVVADPSVSYHTPAVSAAATS